MPVEGIDPVRVKLDHLHAVAGRWVDDHHWANTKPWSIRPARRIDGVAVFELTTLTHAAATRFTTAITPGQPIRLGTQHGTILTQPHIIDAQPWNRLHPTPTPAAHAWSVTFLTPTTFGNGNRFSPWPDPSSIARSLTTRWNTLRPNNIPQLPEDPKLWRRVWVSDIDGHSEVLDLQNLTLSGFLGRVRYVCEDPQMAAIFQSLLTFAEYAGVGRYPTRGLGAIRLEPTWEPGATSHAARSSGAWDGDPDQ
ncbi:CRISPR system precrRNA processing endoribonuclease RAMP protein Cas6 [Nocardia salmonicida]|uniref:CRISPR system precrRNA processing endoribonuclease RAMP protein Cas6 n=1 Tax=Nocardia salmonicida TaxID=53431 RepID=UPI0037B2D29F